jgi:hypothetical protein
LGPKKSGLNILAAFFVERLRNPKIKLAIEDPPFKGQIMPGALEFRALRVLVSNAPLGWPFGWFVNRAPAPRNNYVPSFHRCEGHIRQANGGTVGWFATA